MTIGRYITRPHHRPKHDTQRKQREKTYTYHMYL